MIHIACNIDSSYVKHCGTTLISLFENNPKTEFCIHIIAQSLSQSDRDVLTALAVKYKHHMYFYSPDMRMLKGFTIRATHNRLSLAAYYRCFLSAILPQDIDRVLYLDCDIIILGNICPLWETPLSSDIALTAVEDMGCHEKHRYEIMQYPEEYSYFNSGVLLINLSYWREHHVAQACIDFYHKYPERIIFNDQDLLNCVLYAHKKLVGLQWNVQDGFYRNTRSISPEWRTKNQAILEHPLILHFTNRKPWNYDSQHPLRNIYFKYWALTPWSNEHPWNSFPNQIKRFFRLLPFYVGLRKPKYITISKK